MSTLHASSTPTSKSSGMPTSGLAWLLWLSLFLVLGAPVSAQDPADEPSTEVAVSKSVRMLESFARGESVSLRLVDGTSKRLPARRESTAVDLLGRAVDRLRTVDAGDRGAAVEDLLAADLLVRERFASVARRLEAESLPGMDRLDAARTAYGERMDPVVDRLRALLDGSGEPRAKAAAFDPELLDDLGDLVSTANRRTLRALLPYRSTGLGSRPLPAGPAVTPVYADASDPGSTAEDLRGTATAPLSPAILSKAAELGHDYVAIYEFVRHGVALEWYGGSVQGAEGALASGTGNDVDQASLLVALLRASGAAARFVHGVIEVDLAVLAADLDVAADAVPSVLARAGVAAEPVIRGGRLAAVRLEHTWVAAHVPYTNYRGAVVDTSGRTWVPLDPSWTRFEHVASTALTDLGFDASAFRAEYLSTRQDDLPLDVLRARVESHLFAQGDPDPDWRDAVGRRTAVEKRLGILPSSLPYAVVSVVGEASALDATGVEAAEARFLVRAGESEGSTPVLDARVPLRRLASRRVTLSYVPATVDDHRLSSSFGGLGSVPAYLVRLRPVLKIDGRVESTGEPLDMGVAHRLDLDLSGAWGTERASRTLISGAYAAIAVGGPRVAETVDSDTDPSGLDPSDTEGLAARVLSRLALRYGASWDASEEELARWLGVTVVRPVPSVAFVAHAVRVTTLAGLPADLDWQGLETDAALRIAEPVGARSGAWRKLSALQGSALEHRLFEDALGVESLSADKGLGLARDLGIAVQTLVPGDDPSSLSLSSFSLSPTVLAEVAEALASGHTVHVPEAEIALEDWTGAVWRVEDPSTGAEGYFLSGGLAGGVTTVNPSEWDPDVADELEDPYSEPPNLDPLSGDFLEPIWEWNGRHGTVDQLFEDPIGVIVLDAGGRPVKGAVVTFTLETGGGELRSGTRKGSELAVQTDERGRARVRVKSGKYTADQASYVFRDAADTYPFRVLQNRIKASVLTGEGVLELSRPLVAYGFPGAVASYERVNKDPDYPLNEYFRSHMGISTDIMRFRALDALGNPVANVGKTVFSKGYTENYGSLGCWVPDAPTLATFYDAGLGSNGLPDECSSLVPRIGECGRTLQTVESRSDGRASIGVIPGTSWVQYEVGTRDAHEVDIHCEARLESGDARADFASACSDLFAESEEDPVLSTEDYYYTFEVRTPSGSNSPGPGENPCTAWVSALFVAEGVDAHTAVGVGQTLEHPLVFAHFTLLETDCEALDTPYCDPSATDLGVGGVDYPNCTCGEPADGAWCDPCKRMWDLCSYGDQTMPLPGCLGGFSHVWDGSDLWHTSEVQTSCSAGCTDGDPDTNCSCELVIPSSMEGQRCNWQETYTCADQAWEWRPSFLSPEHESTRMLVTEPSLGASASDPIPMDPRIGFRVTGGPVPGEVELSVAARSYPWWIYPDYKGEMREGDTRYLSTLAQTQSATLTLPVIRPAITSVSPERIVLDAEGRTLEPIVVDYAIEPASYGPIGVHVTLNEGVENPVHVAEGRPTTSGSSATTSSTAPTKNAGTGRAVFPRGLKLDASWSHDLRLVVNPGTRWEVRPAANDVDVARKPLPLDGTVILRADPSVGVTQTVDLARSRGCATSDVFSFQLVRNAQVSLKARPVDGRDPDGTTQYGDELEIFDQYLEAEGPGPDPNGPSVTLEHHSPITIEDLPPGDYQMVLRAEADDGTVEVRRVHGFSKVSTSDSLPLGHTLIEGVDLWDGSLSVSRKDFEIPGRGPSLEFRRTYSSSNGAAQGPLGIGWGHNYQSSAFLSPCGILTISGGEGSGMQFDMTGAPTTGKVELAALEGYHGSLIVDADEGSLDYYTLSGNRYRYVPGTDEGSWVLDRIVDPNGNAVVLTYGIAADGLQLLEVEDAVGRKLVLTYERASFVAWQGAVITAVTGPLGLRLDLEYDDYGHLVAARREGNARAEQYHYSPQPDWNYTVRHVLDRVEDLVTGAETTYTYQVAPIAGHQGTKQSLMVTEVRTPEVQDAGSLPLAFDYDEEELLRRGGSAITVVHDRRGQPTTYTFNDYGAVTSVTDALGHTTLTTWDLEEVLLEDRTDARQILTDFVHDEHGNLRSETTGPWTKSYTYYPETDFDPPYLKNRVHTETDRNGHVTTFVYDLRGNRTSETTDLGTADGRPARSVTVTHTYDARGDRVSTTDGRGHTTHFLYDDHGFPKETRDALHRTTYTTYDARGRLREQIDAEGRTTRLSYDTLDRVVRKVIEDENGVEAAVETYDFDDAARTRTSTDAEGRVTVTHFDLEGRVVRIDNAEEGAKVFEYDGEGNKILESLWHDSETPRHDVIYTYDDAGRLDLRREPLGRTTDYDHDEVGNKIRETLYDETDPTFEPRVTEWPSYDELNRATREEKTLIHPITGAQSTVVMEHEYDGEGQVIREVDALQRTTLRTFDGLGREIVVSEGDGLRVTRSYYDDASHLEKTVLTNPSPGSGDQTRTFTYDAGNRLVSRTDAEGETTFLDYDDVDRMIRTTDARGTITEYGYDALDHQTEERLRLQRGRDETEWSVTTYIYDRVGNLKEELPPNGNRIVHTYDALNRRLTTTDTLGAVGSWTYDARGNELTKTDGEGHTTVLLYDALDRPYEETLPETRKILRVHDAAGNVVQETDPENRVRTYAYDTLNRQVQTTDPSPFLYTTTTTYDAVGNAIATTDRRGHTTDLSYDALNRLVERKAPEVDGTRLTQTYTYDAADNRLTEIDGRGILTVHRYDRENRRVETKRAEVTLETIQYDAVGHPRFVTDANGHTTGFVYDERGLVLEENRPESSVTRHTYDLQGNRTHTHDPLQRETRYTHDERNRQETIEVEVEPGRFAATRTTYDRNNRRLTLERPEGGVRTYVYDDAGRLETVETTLREESGTIQTAITTYGYDKNDNLRTVDDAEGRRTEYVYDELNRRKDKIYPQTAIEPQPSTEHWTYDENGNIKTFTDAEGQVFVSTWDALNRERTRTYPAQDPSLLSDHLLQIETTYDGNHNVTRVDETYSDSGLQTTVQTWDDFDRLETVTDRWNRRITYGYDAAGNRTRLEAPGQTSTYTFDGLNRLETVTTAGGLTTYAYHPNSRLKSVAYPNGTTVDYTFDTANRLESIEHRQGELLISSYDYVYDDNGNRTEQTEYQYGRSTELTTYGYDLADRLEAVAYPDEQVTYGYDKVGNRVTETVTPVAGSPYVKTYAYDLRDRLESIQHDLDPAETVGYTYDKNGNQRSKTKNGTTTTYTVTSRNQIARIEENGLPIGTYGYDHRGLRVRKYTDRETRYLYDDQSVLQRHDTIDGTTQYEYGPDRLLSVDHPTEGRSYYLHDALGSIVGLTTEGGSLLAQYSYDAWGHRRHEISAESNVFGFTGHETDPESGLIYARARFYDPDTGRFLSHDPVEGDPEAPPSLHRYLYVYQNPTSGIDPDGRELKPADYIYAAKETLVGVGRDVVVGAGQGLKGATDLALGGNISAVEAGIQAFNESEGDLLDRARMGAEAANEARMEVATFGYSSAESKVGHTKELLGVAPIERAGTLYGEAWETGNWEKAAEATAELGQGLATIAGWAEGGTIGLARRGIVPKPKQRGRTTRESKDEPGTETGVTSESNTGTAAKGGAGDARTSPWLADSRPAVVEHLERFRDGGAFLVPKSLYKRFIEGQERIGRPDGQFLTTKSEMDRLLHETGGDLSAINKRLGVNWQEPLVRVDVNDPLLHNARLPSGLELGADPEAFRWGGYTSGGMSEIVVDQIPAAGFTGTAVSPR